MVEMDLLREAFRQRRERLEERPREGEGRGPSPKERLQDPALADAAKKALEALESAPDVRWERVKEIKRKLEDGSLEFDSKAVADRLLQESILNELL